RTARRSAARRPSLHQIQRGWQRTRPRRRQQWHRGSPRHRSLEGGEAVRGGGTIILARAPCPSGLSDEEAGRVLAGGGPPPVLYGRRPHNGGRHGAAAARGEGADAEAPARTRLPGFDPPAETDAAGARPPHLSSLIRVRRPRARGKFHGWICWSMEEMSGGATTWSTTWMQCRGRPKRRPPSLRGLLAAQMLFSIRFHHAWAQDILLLASYNESGKGRIVADDAYCIAEFFILPRETKSRMWRQIMTTVRGTSHFGALIYSILLLLEGCLRSLPM
ncbi:unnamed protein product, partial [Urochloa humidicola]